MSPVVFFSKKEGGKFEIWIPLESPQFHWIGIGVAASIPLLELDLGHSKNQFQRIAIGVWNCEFTPILFQTLAFHVEKPQAKCLTVDNLNLAHSKNRFQRIGIWNCELTPILFKFNSFPTTKNQCLEKNWGQFMIPYSNFNSLELVFGMPQFLF